MRRLAVPLFLSLLVAACGGEGGGDERLSREALATKANAICERFETRINALGTPQNLEDLETFAEKARPIFEEGLGDLRELQPPEDLEQRYDEWLSTGDRALERVDELGEAAKDGDTAKVQQIAERAETEDRESDRLARALGLDDCAED